MKIQLLDYAPDIDSTVYPGKFGQAYLTDANWIYSTRGGWDAIGPPLHPNGTPHLPLRCQGMFAYEIPNNTQKIILGTADQLYVYENTSADSQNLVLTSTINPWSFTVYGTDLIAVNGVDKPVVSINGANFVPLAGNPPVFSIIEATDFSLFGVVPNSQTVYFTFNDTLWVPNIATETGTIPFTGTSGNITAAHRVRAGIAIFKANALYMGNFSGPPLFWNFQAVSESVGTLWQDAVVSADDVLFFVGPNDFFTFDGFSLNPIPNNLSRWFFTHLSIHSQTFPGFIRGAYDQVRRQVIWFFLSKEGEAQFPQGSIPPYLDRYVSFSVLTGKWSTGYRKVEAPLVNGTAPIFAPPHPLPPAPDPGLNVNLVFGFVDEGHMLRFIDQSAIDDHELAWVTLGAIGDKTGIWRLARANPGFLSVPVGHIPPFTPIPPLPSLDVLGTYISGVPDTRIQTCRWSPQTGFFDFVTAGRMQRLKVMFYPGYVLSDLDVDVTFAGRQ